MENRIVDYLAKAIMVNSPMPLRKDFLEAVLRDISIPETSRRNISIAEDEVDILWSPGKNYQDEVNDGVICYLNLKRLLRNSPNHYVPRFYETTARKAEAVAYKAGLISFNPRLISRFIRENKGLARIMLDSAMQGHEYSILGLFGKTYYQPGEKEITIRRPLIVIPGITAENDLKKIRAFETLYQDPSDKKVVETIEKGNYKEGLLDRFGLEID